MSAFATLTINDGTAGVAFVPTSLVNNLALWRYNSGIIYETAYMVTMSVSLPSAKSKVARVKQKVVIPVFDPITDAKTGELVCNIEFILPRDSQNADRVKLRNFAKNLIADAVTTAAVDTFAGIY